MAKNDKIDLENNGDNQGVMVGVNTGTILMTLNQTKKIPSLISIVVKALGLSCTEFNDPVSLSMLDEYKPDDKLEYNSVYRYKYVIKEFSTYYLHCDNILNIYDDSNMGSKARILKCVHTWYLEEKGKILYTLRDPKKDEIEIIKENSDNLIDKVKSRIIDIIEKSDIEDFCGEDLEIGIACFICYCFMECKILEKPI